MARKRRWEEREHPRNPANGEFVEKGTGAAAWAAELSRRISAAGLGPEYHARTQDAPGSAGSAWEERVAGQVERQRPTSGFGIDPRDRRVPDADVRKYVRELRSSMLFDKPHDFGDLTDEELQQLSDFMQADPRRDNLAKASMAAVSAEQQRRQRGGMASAPVPHSRASYNDEILAEANAVEGENRAGGDTDRELVAQMRAVDQAKASGDTASWDSAVDHLRTMLGQYLDEGDLPALPAELQSWKDEVRQAIRDAGFDPDSEAMQIDDQEYHDYKDSPADYAETLIEEHMHPTGGSDFPGGAGSPLKAKLHPEGSSVAVEGLSGVVTARYSWQGQDMARVDFGDGEFRDYNVADVSAIPSIEKLRERVARRARVQPGPVEHVTDQDLARLDDAAIREVLDEALQRVAVKPLLGVSFEQYVVDKLIVRLYQLLG